MASDPTRQPISVKKETHKRLKDKLNYETPTIDKVITSVLDIVDALLAKKKKGGK